jgi:hypothetical protein
VHAGSHGTGTGGLDLVEGWRAPPVQPGVDVGFLAPRGRGFPIGIAEAVFLAVDNIFITGTTLHVDGGGRSS